MKGEWVALLAAAFVMTAVPMFAHHAGVLYDREHPVTVSGTVTEFQFINPHARIYFEVKDEDGNLEKWIGETAGPQRLFRVGWNAKTLKPGDKVDVKGAPFKDGRKVMSIFKLTGGKVPVLTLGAE